MAETGKKKFMIKRKPFIITIVAVCVVLAIAEVLLLTKVFSGKKDDKKTDKQSNQQTGTPTPTEPEVMTDVWKVSKMYVQYEGDEKKILREYEYDESGRERGVRYWTTPGGTTTLYDNNFQNVTRRDRPFNMDYVSLGGEDAVLSDSDSPQMTGAKGTWSFEEKFDDSGKLIEVSKLFEGTESVYEKWEFEFDDQNRAVKMKDYESVNGGLKLFRYFLYQYDSFDRIKCVEEYWIQNDGRIETKLEYDYANNRIVRTMYEYRLKSTAASVLVYSGKQRVSLTSYQGDAVNYNLQYLVLKGNFPYDEDFESEVFPFGKRYRGVSMEKLDQDGYYQKESYWKLDEKGRPVSFSDDEVCLTYDDQDYVIRAEATDFGERNIFEFTYDENGNMTEVRITNEDGQIHSYIYEWVKLPNR